jgi:trans-aconitate methyltransferase
MSQPPDFNRLARFYRWMELVSFGPWLWWCRCAFLGELGACRYALILGDGDGRFTARLLQANPAVRIDAIDASPAMLKALVRRAGQNRSRVRAQMADARYWLPKSQPDQSLEDPSYDLVVTHFFLVPHRRCRPTGYETDADPVVDCFSASGTEVVRSLVRMSPFPSWTRNP